MENLESDRDPLDVPEGGLEDEIDDEKIKIPFMIWTCISCGARWIAKVSSFP